MEEVWKPVVGKEGKYSVSSLGRLRTEARTLHYRNGRTRTLRQRVLRGNITNHGYLVAAVDGKGGGPTLVHRLVLEAFCGPCPDGHEGCHNNGDKLDNRIENLRWDSRTANHADKREHGTLLIGERHPNAKLTVEDIAAIRRDPRRQRDLASVYGVSQSHIHRIRTGKRWAAEAVACD